MGSFVGYGYDYMYIGVGVPVYITLLAEKIYMVRVTSNPGNRSFTPKSREREV